jgi:hypothetical protein
VGGHRVLFAPWRAAISFAFVFSAFWLPSSPAQAQFYVRSLEVEKGVAEVEEHGAVYAGPGEEERLRQSHEVEFKYGFTDRFEGIVEGFFDQEISGNFEAKQFELGGQYEIIQRERNGFGLAFRTIYEFALQDHSPDEILFGPLAKFVRGRDSITVNTFFVGQVGNDVEIDSLELKVFWRLKHELTDKWALGLEAYSEIEDLAHAGGFEDQQHRVGPVIYFNIGEEEENEAAGDGSQKPEWKLAGGQLRRQDFLDLRYPRSRQVAAGHELWHAYHHRRHWQIRGHHRKRAVCL